MMTVWFRLISAWALSGVIATRCSPIFVSAGIPYSTFLLLFASSLFQMPNYKRRTVSVGVIINECGGEIAGWHAG